MNNDLKSVPMMARIFSYSGRCAKISLKFTDKVPFFDDFSLNDSDFAKCSAARQLPAQLRFEILSTFEAARAEFG
ncbi:hypothetical protein GKD00_08205 [Lactobacillus ruminis]|nr:hypothetical protein [Ligilactobacillus ruminis]MSB54850.1 hypothetical protein [Ligilactobacillus ruminis]MSB56568.1 hypothetical protein [Ligilactobacillus ruminis]MSB81932.1 hypothetical protein [Ligilactobacillus ruminis]MSB91484.1 hypothetical protein [Ligilactobacillus ruminis]